MATCELLIKIGKDKTTYSFSTGKKTEFVVMGANNKDINLNGTMKKLDVVKVMGKPNSIEADIDITGNSLPEMAELNSAFQNVVASLKFTSVKEVDGAPQKTEKTFTGFTVFNVGITTKYKAGEVEGMKARLDIYSNDKFADLTYTSKAFTAKKLFGDIVLPEIQGIEKNLFNEKIKPEVDKIQNDINNKQSELDKEKDEAKKAILKEEIKTLNDKLNKLQDEKDNEYKKDVLINPTKGSINLKDDQDLIHPFLVQYDETFYSFMLRTVNRCGGYLYFEDGKLHIGHAGGTERKIDELFTTNEITKIGNCDNTVFSTAVNKKDTDYQEGAYENELSLRSPKDASDKEALSAYVTEIGKDDYLQDIEKDKYDSANDQVNKDQSISMPVTNLLCSQNLMEFVTKTAADEIKTWASSASFAAANNKAFNKKYFENITDKSKYSSDKKTYREFGTYTTGKEWNANLYNKFYSCIRRVQDTPDRRKIAISHTGEYIEIMLGDTAKTDGTNYIVTGVRYTETYSSLLGAKQKQTVELTEEVNIKNSAGKNENYFIAERMCEPIRRVEGGMRAVVTDNMDPIWAGRVRARFDWGDGDNATPWIAVRSLSSKGECGVYFQPEEKDTVMLGFEGGNIERPYVEGALFTSDVSPRWGGRIYDDVISCRNGHSIKFNTIATAGQVGGVFGFPGAIFTSLLSVPVPNDNNLIKTTGGIEIGDDNGWYQIAMSSNNRSVTIQSMFGNVDINAFTGIKISAPNGSVKISGQNVNITAGDKLTMTSGKNIMESIGGAGFGFQAGKALASFLESKTVDMNLLRHILDAFIRPVDGSMEIVSFNNILMESGGSHANINPEIKPDIDKMLDITAGEAQKLHEKDRSNSNIFMRQLYKMYDMRDYEFTETILYYNIKLLKKLISGIFTVTFYIKTVDVDNKNTDDNARKKEFKEKLEVIIKTIVTGKGLSDSLVEKIKNLDFQMELKGDEYEVEKKEEGSEEKKKEKYQNVTADSTDREKLIRQVLYEYLQELRSKHSIIEGRADSEPWMDEQRWQDYVDELTANNTQFKSWYSRILATAVSDFSKGLDSVKKFFTWSKEWSDTTNMGNLYMTDEPGLTYKISDLNSDKEDLKGDLISDPEYAWRNELKNFE